MTLQTLERPRHVFFAVGSPSGIVHILPYESPFSAAYCRVRPDPEWDRIFSESLDRGARPLGLCRRCYEDIPH